MKTIAMLCLVLALCGGCGKKAPLRLPPADSAEAAAGAEDLLPRQ